MCSLDILRPQLPHEDSEECSDQVDANNILGGILQIIPFQAMKIALIFASSVNPDEMLHYVASHLGLHCQFIE